MLAESLAQLGDHDGATEVIAAACRKNPAMPREYADKFLELTRR